jgi:hypothetical protein
MELGNVQNTANSARVLSTPHSEISKNKIIEENPTDALIKYSHRAESSVPRNDDKVNSLFDTPTNRLEDFCTAVAEKVEEYEQMVRTFSDGRFSPREYLENWPDLDAEKVLHLLKDD